MLYLESLVFSAQTVAGVLCTMNRIAKSFYQDASSSIPFPLISEVLSYLNERVAMAALAAVSVASSKNSHLRGVSTGSGSDMVQLSKSIIVRNIAC